jgi:hypothetical protein
MYEGESAVSLASVLVELKKIWAVKPHRNDIEKTLFSSF